LCRRALAAQRLLNQPDDLQLLAERATNGLVAIVDPSPTMIAQASGRNRNHLRSGRVELKIGSVSTIPYPAASFDKVCTIIYFWPSRVDDLREIRRVMKDDGKLALAFRIERIQQSHLSFRVSIPKKRSVSLPAAGFRDARAIVRKTTPWIAGCVLARK
jgi:ubiquinone/menaquinone biosynthesis C-methylase UbiE